ncbi:ATP-binding protein [Burkholderia cenocepacia]|uniref:ATP-binding protein n=1 Tax=Burkholderia cenocepacia TaxID=95486 RepID=UPI002AAFBDC5|nr:ATP-binding protein [Burkholderia cenocepacia]
MAIFGYDDSTAFGLKLNSVVSPAQPIQSIEHLFGRSNELERIRQALFAPGRHSFIYGDRGVGKSSLAATAANLYQSADAAFIDVSGGPDATLRSIVSNIAIQATKTSRLTKKKTTTSLGAEWRFFKVGKTVETSSVDLRSEIVTLADAVELLREVAAIHSDLPVVVLDEFDRIQSPEERALFGDLLKQLGDKKVALKFIFTGVGDSIEELLGAHPSAIRQLDTLELPKLSWDARWDIPRKVAETFGLTLDREIYIRIAAVSDGYPYYAHLITEKMMWDVFNDSHVIHAIEQRHYLGGLHSAIAGISAELQRPYMMALNQRSGDYEEILWSTADSEYLDRYLAQMFSSYEHIMRQRPQEEAIDYKKYAARIRKLKSPSCGEILVSHPTKPGLYTYREKMLRGYVRMQAEAHGIELAGEKIPQSEKPTMHVRSSAGRGYYGPSVPAGIHLGRQRRKESGD